MLTIAYYFLQVVLCSTLMMGYYWLVLRNKRFHQYNRFYLLAVALFSWIVPLVKIQWGHTSVNNDPRVMQFLSVVADNNTYIEQTLSHKGFAWSRGMIATGLYTAVSAALLFAMVHAFVRIYRLLKVHSCKNVGEVYLVFTQARGTPFSFFRYIFWNEEIDIRSESGKQILQHELTHVQQKHSIDKIFIQGMLVFGWFNPFFWILKKEMEMIHEFIADKRAVKNGDTASLAQMLLTAAYPNQRFTLTNPFFFSPIKRRLQMLTNTRYPRFSYLRRLVVLPLVGIVVVLFAFRNKEKNTQITLSVATVIEKVAPGKSTAPIIENIKAFMKERYPVARDTIITVWDTVAVGNKNKFVVGGKDENGREIPVTKLIPHTYNGIIVSESRPLAIVDGKKIDYDLLDLIDPNKIASIDVLKNEAATGVYGEEGRDGVVWITTKKNLAKQDTLLMKEGATGKGMPNNVLVVIDGIKGGDLRALPPSDIASINVLKNETATALYGEAGKNGVVVVATKKNDFKMPAGIRVTPHGALMQEVILPKAQTSPSFPGGKDAWQQYLQRNLNLDLIVQRGGPPGKYTVSVSFIVDKEGNLSNLIAENDPGYGTAEEAVRVITKGPKWIPAMLNGKNVIVRHKQSITWVIAESDPVIKKSGKKDKARAMSAKELAFEKKLKEFTAQNSYTFFEIDGNSGVAGKAGGYASIDGKTDIVFVNGKRMTPAELNRNYRRDEFVLLAADASSEVINKYGKGVLVVSSKTLTPEALKKMIL